MQSPQHRISLFTILSKNIKAPKNGAKIKVSVRRQKKEIEEMETERERERERENIPFP